MITKQGQVQRIKPFLRESKQQSQWITLWVLGFIAFGSAIAIAGLLHLEAVGQFFNWLNEFQRQMAECLRAPDSKSAWLLSLGLVLGTQAIIRISPQPKHWSRILVITVLLVLTARYVLWRSLTTLNLSTPLNGFFSLSLFLIEILVVSNAATRLFLTLRERDRRHEANRYAIAVETGAFLPSVDVLIPTHSEPAFVLRRTIIGCQAMDYPHKTIYLLDDGKRGGNPGISSRTGVQLYCPPC
ncbi:hypothetical protein K9N68_10150 [Kovacikia minuta CCNUW1]|uniref:glycosyltransferase family 2 protein n=1 Tax=Kovacikia minuta TaxID=2931930 RepID=UPI001CCC35EA|nr:glycosyltransferase family 2 protein [Kovacikia minuta]UBF28204.1 hypothetical protein K9N68_10150 [Kovacikia minuta CCNUW1]